MKQKILILSLLILTVSMHSCVLSPSVKGDGNVTEEERKTADFDGIKASRGMNVYITQGDDFRVMVKADENLHDYIETQVDNGILVVSSSANIRKSKAKAVYVTLPNVETVKASAGSNVFTESGIRANELDVKSSAGSNINLEVKADKIMVSASAGSNIWLKGAADQLNAAASSGSNIKAGDLKTDKAEIKVSSGANIWTLVDQSFSAKASSGGNIFYAGNPSQTEINKSSGGNVIKN